MTTEKRVLNIEQASITIAASGSRDPFCLDGQPVQALFVLLVKGSGISKSCPRTEIHDQEEKQYSKGVLGLSDSGASFGIRTTSKWPVQEEQSNTGNPSTGEKWGNLMEAQEKRSEN